MGGKFFTSCFLKKACLVGFFSENPVSGPQGGNIINMNSNRHLKFIPPGSVTGGEGNQKPKFPKTPYYTRFFEKTRCKKFATYYLILTIFLIKKFFTSNISSFKINQMTNFCLQSKVLKLTYQLLWTLDRFLGFLR